MQSLWLPLSALFGFLGVALGAFGAHALRQRLDSDMLRVWETAVNYQFWHALALLGVGSAMAVAALAVVWQMYAPSISG